MAMKQVLITVALTLALTLPGLAEANARFSQPDEDEQDEQYNEDAAETNQHDATGTDVFLKNGHIMSLAGTGWHHYQNAAPSPVAAASPATPVATDAKNAHEAAKVAKQAAHIANKVAKHSMKITGHAKKALKHALGALHDARVDSAGLKKDQKESLKKAEAHLREATKKADYGKLKKLKDAEDLQKEKMEDDLDKSKSSKTEKEQMLDDLKKLRKSLKGKKGAEEDVKALDDLESDIKESDGKNSDEAKAEIEKMRESIDHLEDKEADEGKLEYQIPKGKGDKDEKDEKDEKDAKDEKDKKGKTLKDGKAMQEMKGGSEKLEKGDEVATPVEEKGLDIDTQMPYGDLEPFGREDTAQELTESSIKESDQMVDQLERAEVAEEKRAVFRALTRLRGAAITSYDGVARSQTGNIDEYNQIHKWRKVHPLHHLADEESDVTKWAFPDNAD